MNMFSNAGFPQLSNSPGNPNSFPSFQIMAGASNPLTPIPIGANPQNFNAYQNPYFSGASLMQNLQPFSYGGPIIPPGSTIQYGMPTTLSGQNQFQTQNQFQAFNQGLPQATA